jgi:hypothetical protein
MARGQPEVNHFQRIGHADIDPLLKLLPTIEHWWKYSTLRQKAEGSPHKDTESIYLRMPKVVDLHTVFESMEVVDWPPMPNEILQQLIYDVSHLAYAVPARVMLVKLHPGGYITPHIDQGKYAEATDRYHLCVTSNARCEMQIGNEVVMACPEEVWWFDKHAEHSVLNGGKTPRIHLIVDCWKV